MAFTKIIIDRNGVLLLMLLTLSSISATNIDCNGKAFHCVNSTHFMICVDLGTGVSTTIDDYVIPCPLTTACKSTNRYECEFPTEVQEETTTIPVTETIITEATSNTPELTTSIPIEEYLSTTLASDSGLSTSDPFLNLQPIPEDITSSSNPETVLEDNVTPSDVSTQQFVSTASYDVDNFSVNDSLSVEPHDAKIVLATEESLITVSSTTDKPVLNNVVSTESNIAVTDQVVVTEELFTETSQVSTDNVTNSENITPKNVVSLPIIDGRDSALVSESVTNFTTEGVRNLEDTTQNAGITTEFTLSTYINPESNNMPTEYNPSLPDETTASEVSYVIQITTESVINTANLPIATTLSDLPVTYINYDVTTESGSTTNNDIISADINANIETTTDFISMTDLVTEYYLHTETNINLLDSATNLNEVTNIIEITTENAINPFMTTAVTETVADVKAIGTESIFQRDEDLNSARTSVNISIVNKDKSDNKPVELNLNEPNESIAVTISTDSGNQDSFTTNSDLNVIKETSIPETSTNYIEITTTEASASLIIPDTISTTQHITEEFIPTKKPEPEIQDIPNSVKFNIESVIDATVIPTDVNTYTSVPHIIVNTNGRYIENNENIPYSTTVIPTDLSITSDTTVPNIVVEGIGRNIENNENSPTIAPDATVIPLDVNTMLYQAVPNVLVDANGTNVENNKNLPIIASSATAIPTDLSITSDTTVSNTIIDANVKNIENNQNLHTAKSDTTVPNINIEMKGSQIESTEHLPTTTSETTATNIIFEINGSTIKNNGNLLTATPATTTSNVIVEMNKGNIENDENLATTSTIFVLREEIYQPTTDINIDPQTDGSIIPDIETTVSTVTEEIVRNYNIATAVERSLKKDSSNPENALLDVVNTTTPFSYEVTTEFLPTVSVTNLGVTYLDDIPRKEPITEKIVKDAEQIYNETGNSQNPPKLAIHNEKVILTVNMDTSSPTNNTITDTLYDITETPTKNIEAALQENATASNHESSILDITTAPADIFTESNTHSIKEVIEQLPNKFVIDHQPDLLTISAPSTDATISDGSGIITTVNQIDVSINNGAVTENNNVLSEVTTTDIKEITTHVTVAGNKNEYTTLTPTATGFKEILVPSVSAPWQSEIASEDISISHTEMPYVTYFSDIIDNTKHVDYKDPNHPILESKHVQESHVDSSTGTTISLEGTTEALKLNENTDLLPTQTQNLPEIIDVLLKPHIPESSSTQNFNNSSNVSDSPASTLLLQSETSHPTNDMASISTNFTEKLNNHTNDNAFQNTNDLLVTKTESTITTFLDVTPPTFTKDSDLSHSTHNPGEISAALDYSTVTEHMLSNQEINTLNKNIKSDAPNSDTVTSTPLMPITSNPLTKDDSVIESPKTSLKESTNSNSNINSQQVETSPQDVVSFTNKDFNINSDLLKIENTATTQTTISLVENVTDVFIKSNNENETTINVMKTAENISSLNKQDSHVIDSTLNSNIDKKEIQTTLLYKSPTSTTETKSYDFVITENPTSTVLVTEVTNNSPIDQAPILRNINYDNKHETIPSVNNAQESNAFTTHNIDTSTKTNSLDVSDQATVDYVLQTKENKSSENIHKDIASQGVTKPLSYNEPVSITSPVPLTAKTSTTTENYKTINIPRTDSIPPQSIIATRKPNTSSGTPSNLANDKTYAKATSEMASTIPLTRNKQTLQAREGNQDIHIAPKEPSATRNTYFELSTEATNKFGASTADTVDLHNAGAKSTFESTSDNLNSLSSSMMPQTTESITWSEATTDKTEAEVSVDMKHGKTHSGIISLISDPLNNVNSKNKHKAEGNINMNGSSENEHKRGPTQEFTKDNSAPENYTPNNKSEDQNKSTLNAYKTSDISNVQSSTPDYSSQTKATGVSTAPELSTRKSNLNNFECKQKRGRYADKQDCRKFYVCLGNGQVISGTCPVNTVFSEMRKQCTKNLSHCIRNNQFQCVTVGRFSDFLNDNTYYICVKNTLSAFIRFKLQCQNGYYLNKTSVRCALNELSKSDSSINNSDQSVSSVKQEDIEKPKVFRCKKEGRFEDPSDCRRYFECSKTGKNSYRQKRKRCDSDEIFDSDKKKCVDDDSHECD